MTSPSLAIMWSTWDRHRTGFIASLLGLTAVAIVNRLLTAAVPAEVLVAGLSTPLVCLSGFILNALIFVEQQGSLSSRYPRYLFALPVRTRTLAFWPMLLASTCAGLLWVAASLSIVHPDGYHLPVLVPALGLAAMMAWAQALAWLPIAVPWLREVINVTTVAALSVVPISLTVLGAGSRGRLATLFAVYIVTAFALACAAVASDRHGRTWRFWPTFRRFGGATKAAEYHRKRPFRSAFEAQVWYEWNCHGLMLNGFVAAAFLLVWGVLISAGRHGNFQWFATIIVILLIVVVALIASTAASFGRLSPFWSRSRRFYTFVPVRPMTTMAIVTAKFQMAAASVLLSWGLAVALTVIWIFISGNVDNAATMFRNLFTRYPGARALAVIVLACVLLPALSWRMLTGPVTPVLADRRWVDQGAVFAYLSMIILLFGSGSWLANHPDDLARMSSPVLALAVASFVPLVRFPLATLALDWNRHR